jgi:hypothetical protein
MPCFAGVAVSPLEIGDANRLAALTLTLSRAGSGTGEGSLLFIVFVFEQAQLMGTPR